MATGETGFEVECGDDADEGQDVDEITGGEETADVFEHGHGLRKKGVEEEKTSQLERRRAKREDGDAPCRC